MDFKSFKSPNLHSVKFAKSGAILRHANVKRLIRAPAKVKDNHQNQTNVQQRALVYFDRGRWGECKAVGANSVRPTIFIKKLVNQRATKGRPSILDLLLSKNKKFFYSACNIFALFVHLYYDGR